jgi:hypothetical protein
VAAQTFSGAFNLDEKSRSLPPPRRVLAISSTKGQFHLALKKAAVMRSNRQTLSCAFINMTTKLPYIKIEAKNDCYLRSRSHWKRELFPTRRRQIDKRDVRLGNSWQV